VITDRKFAGFYCDGDVKLDGNSTDWVKVMAAGLARNLAEPDEYAYGYNVTEGCFNHDSCNGSRIPEYERILHKIPAAELAARITQSNTAQLFHDHVLIRESRTPTPTLCHQDNPYYFIGGEHDWLPVIGGES